MYTLYTIPKLACIVQVCKCCTDLLKPSVQGACKPQTMPACVARPGSMYMQALEFSIKQHSCI